MYLAGRPSDETQEWLFEIIAIIGDKLVAVKHLDEELDSYQVCVFNEDGGETIEKEGDDEFFILEELTDIKSRYCQKVPA